MLFRSYILEKDYKKAKEFSEQSLRKLPNNPVLWLNLAIANYQLGDNKGALVAAKNSYQLLPGEQAAYVYSALSQGRELKFEE